MVIIYYNTYYYYFLLLFTITYILGTAVVLFELYRMLFKGETFTFGEVCRYFLKMIIISPIIGFLLSIIAYFAMRSLNRVLSEQDVILQIVLSICLAYFAYYVAYIFSLSGILSVFGAGIGFARFSTPLIIKEETLHNIWHFLEWSANTVIFIFAGLIFGGNVLPHIVAADVGYLLLLYILLMVFRLVMVAMHFPIISKIGTKCDKKEALFMVWAGLRGALCILLALIVHRYNYYDIIYSLTHLYLLILTYSHSLTYTYSIILTYTHLYLLLILTY